MINFCIPNGKRILKEHFALEIWTQKTRIGYVYFRPLRLPLAEIGVSYIALKSQKYISDKSLVEFLKGITGINRIFLVRDSSQL